MTEDAWASAGRCQQQSNGAFFSKSETLKDQQRRLIAPSVNDIESQGDSTSTDAAQLKPVEARLTCSFVAQAHLPGSAKELAMEMIRLSLW